MAWLGAKQRLENQKVEQSHENDVKRILWLGGSILGLGGTAHRDRKGFSAHGLRRGLRFRGRWRLALADGGLLIRDQSQLMCATVTE